MLMLLSLETGLGLLRMTHFNQNLIAYAHGLVRTKNYYYYYPPLNVFYEQTTFPSHVMFEVRVNRKQIFNTVLAPDLVT